MPAVAKEVEKQPMILPWEQQLRMKFRAGVAHTFLLTGNVRDLADNRLFLHNYLCKIFLDPIRKGIKSTFDLIVFYDIAQGITFPDVTMQEKFLKLAGGQAPTANATAGVFGGQSKQELKLPTDPKMALSVIEKVLKYRDDDPDKAGIKIKRRGPDNREMHVLVVIDYAESVFPAGNWGQLSDTDRNAIVKILNWAKDPIINENANPIVLIGESGIRMHDNLLATGSRIEQCELLLPSLEERLAYIEEMEAGLREIGEVLDYEDGFDQKKFAYGTAGLKKLNIEDIKLTALHKREKIGPALVKSRKREMYKQEYQSVLEVVEPEFGFDVVGGYEWLKAYFKDEVIAPMLAGKYNLVPQGCLFVGPPGTGKSIFAQALAKEAHLNMVELSIGKLLGSLVGQSEHNMAKALLAIRSLAPVLVWMDEIDQSITRGSSGDSGVSNRLFKMLLEFMADTSLRGRVLFCAATNRPDMMDPALKRRGRFDKIIPFLPPDAGQRKDIFPAVMRRYAYKFEKNIDYDQLAKATERWVGSDIEAGVVKAYTLASRGNGNGVLTTGTLGDAFKLVIPASPDDVELWSNLALSEVSDLELLPPLYRESFDRVALQQKIKKQTMDSASYMLDSRRRNRGDIIGA